VSEQQETRGPVGDVAASPLPATAILVPGLRELGFRVRLVTADTVDLMVDGVRELRRLQLVARDITALGELIATLEIVTDQIYDQDDDEWWIEFSLKRADGGVMRAEDYKAAADEIAIMEQAVNGGRRMAWPSGNLPSV
jgi:hypothetical protein